ncbi:MAG TPA: LapA family protein [Rubrivivax sp.]|nr:LapA family protein [Rubrivivax sp.]
MRILVWLLRAFLFFALFAFALNNLEPVTVHWFFGVQWQSPLVIVVLVAFGLGCALGVLAMVPAWWKHRRTRREPGASLERAPAPGPSAAAAEVPTTTTAAVLEAEHPPREGLGL